MIPRGGHGGPRATEIGVKEVCGDQRDTRTVVLKDGRLGTRRGELQCAGPRQLLLGSSGYFHGLGSVRAGHRTGSQFASLLEAEVQQERIESGIGGVS